MVQVKTGDSPIDRPTLDQLIGTMQNFRAEYGLLVSWSGFKKTVLQVKANQFFKVRLWDQYNILNELYKNYESIDEEIRADIPLKRIWVLTSIEE